ncbi:hypothetical protein IGJ94_000409 [Enterococcus sp. AZ153]|uniref:WxL domain-containing protein n=1 Tax=unclassified Enterococcus TaxID=2608891 RepID=UPI003F288A88
MRKLMKKGMLILGTMILVLHAFLLPVGIVYAETTDRKVGGQVQEEEQLELPSIKNYLEVEEEGNPRFSFPRSHLQGTVEEPLKVTFVSDQEVSEARITLPKEAQLVKDQLQAGVTVNQEESDEWVIQAERVQQTFVLPVVFKSEGNYDVSVEDVTATLEISEKEETETEDQPEMNQDSSNESNEEHEQYPNTTEQSEEKEAPVATEESKEEATPSENETFKQAVFDGNTEEVSTMAAFREAIANPEVSIISVQANLTETTANIMTIDRPIKIQGNGHTLTFGNNSFYFQLAEVSEPTSFRIEDVTVTKTGATPLVNATTEVSHNWTLEIEDVAEVNANTMRLASIPKGTVQFTGGTNNFTRTSSTQTFIEAKEVKAINQAKVTISRGNATIFLAAATISEPKLTIENGANLAITTTSGVANTIDFRGENAEIALQSGGDLTINTVGTTATPTNIRNNTIAMTGTGPKITVLDKSNLTTTSTAAKSGLHLSGNNPQVIVNDSKLSVTSATQSAINLSGDEPTFSVMNSHTDIRSEIGTTLALTGVSPKVNYVGSIGSLISTTGQRLHLNGANPQLLLEQTQLSMSATTGRGVYLEGTTPQVLLNDSSIEMTDTGASQGMILEGTDALLSLKKNSIFNISGGGTGTLENIQVGNDNARPKIDLEDGSKLAITATSGPGAGSATANNAVHLRGNEPELNITDGASIAIDITSGNRRGIALTGNNSTTLVDSSDISLKLGGSGVGYAATGTTNKLAISKSQWEANGSSGHNIHMVGANSTVLLDHSDAVFEAASSGRNIWLAGADSVLAIENGARVNATSDNANSITIHGARALLQMSGSESKMEVISNVSAGEINAAVYLGAASATTTSGAANPNAEVRLTEGAKMNVHANRASALGLLSLNGQFNLLKQSELNLTAGSTNESQNGAVAVLRFIRAGGYQFTIDNAKMNISKSGGRTPGIRMYGGNNHILVRNGGQFFIYNPGNGTPIDQDTSSGLANQGVHYPRDGGNSFVVNGLGSKVQIIADNGAAIDMESQTGEIEARNGATFIAQGRTATDAAGIFNAGNLTVDFDNPLFMDFRNTRVGGGNIFNASSGSTLNAINSDLSVWRKGADLNGDPNLDFRSIDYSFTGTNFNTLRETSDPTQLNTEVFGNTGLTAYSRLSSNNGRWAIVDELRVPTNADKKIYGRVSLPVGLDDSRPAWDDEAIVTVEVESPSGHTQDYTTKTVGHSDESPGISIYGEDPRGGLFEITLPEPLEAGSKVRISHVELTSGELTEGFDHQILTDTVEVFPIVPPAPAKFSSSIIGENSKTIQGISENKEAEVTATHNGQPFDTSDATINDEGRFTLDLSELSLQEDDEIQIFLRDNAGSAKTAGVVDPPKTNNDRGNINPTTALPYHDVTFESATILTVGDLGPVSPVDPMNPEIEVDPENKPELEEDQGLLSIDFASRFTFGQQAISTRTKRYYAQPQRLLNPDGTVNEAEERPNYIQISDRRPEEERHGWQLAVTQNIQFTDLQENELRGARLSLTNQQLESIRGSDEPMLYNQDGVTLIPGEKTKLLTALDGQGAGTWIYRFGDGESASESVALEVPPTANPRASTYETTLTWELSVVPDN